VSVALGIQRTMRMRHIICSLSGSAVFSPHYLINGTILGKKDIQYKMCVWSLSTNSARKISHSKRNSARHLIKLRRSSCKVPVIIFIF
jgi:hypothetical protein